MKFVLTAAAAALSLVGVSYAQANVDRVPATTPIAAPAAQAAKPIIEAQYRYYYRSYPRYYRYYPYDYSSRCQEDLGYGRQGSYGCT